MPRETGETEETGPIQNGIWDTRTQENCYWCDRCKHWIRWSRWITPEDHQRLCKGGK